MTEEPGPIVEGGVPSAERTAAAIAPIVDRLRLAIARRVPERAQHLATELGLTMPAAQVMAMLRNTLPERAIERRQVFDVFLYSPRSSIAASLDELVAIGLLRELDDGRVCPSTTGQEFLAQMLTITASIVEDLWSSHGPLVASLAPLAARAVTAALATGGPALAVMAPVYEPEGASVTMRLAERLTPLRFHRFDAHAAAWRRAGLTAETVPALPAGIERDEIEQNTNRLDSSPYQALTPDERFTLVAGLGALPG